MEADKVLDCIGLYCPMPIVKTAQQLNEMKDGEVLEVIADDKGIKSDMPAWTGKTGHKLLEIEEKDGEFHVFVQKRS
ncbi:MAG: SirA family protein [Candidatus Solincola sediminis]|uniref:SirA family protein n=1 Tax=Candidatus Solincola sediminis TaxID=1797199 RepID=A0A1F2WR01_9ACTN|nr:MAG: SirA family protein [Candidatus Solincola sediminis]OFW59230.1 MAG: SirA family protein [Candidatus Solincola sediminis]